MPSFRNSVRLSALVLFLVAAGAAEATPINYNVNYDISHAHVTGTIQTNGFTGGALTPALLNPGQILNWNLTVSDPFNTCAALGGGTGPCSVNFASPFNPSLVGGSTDTLVGNDLFATATQLYFDNTSPTGGFLRFNSIPGGEVCIGVGQLCAIIAGYDSSVRLNPAHKLTTPAHPNGADYQRQNFTGPGPLVFGTATPVPEPSSLALMAGALAMLGLFGFARTRKAVSARA